ncbi:MAG TPA: proline--tRNA ligase [Gemmatimonadota bacterium]|jgi:prolyl-tRNA synthetase
MRWSRTLIPTLRENPADAEVASHRLMVRAGFLRRLSSGIYTHLPLGVRVLQKVEGIVREELARIGADEILMPVLHPAELWQETRRWEIYGPELMRLRDRHERFFALGPTHEEVVTDLVRGEVRSYRQLPLNLYQIQTKFRDEIRPRFGLLRAREFLMKDAYSFHADEASLDRTYQAYAEAYARIFARCGLEFRAVMADSGAIGGAVSHEFMVLAASGESEVLSCACGYAATSEKAAAGPLPAPTAEDDTDARERSLESGELGGEATLETSGTLAGSVFYQRIRTPGKTTTRDVAAFLGRPVARTVKTLLYVADGEPVFVLVRGDREVNEAKLFGRLDAANLRLATPDEIADATGGPQGFSGPVGLPRAARMLADANLRGLTGAIVGGNEADVHLVGVDVARDVADLEFLDLLQARAGDPCPHCGTPLESSRGIEVGQIFKLGTKYSEAMGATFLNEEGQQVPMRMGCYGIGITRTAAAAIEQHHDENGIRWPFSIAPLHVHLVAIAGRDPEPGRRAEELYNALVNRGVEVLFDDRDERPGVKFADADLIGLPLRLVVGERGLKRGVVELRGDAGRGEAEEFLFEEAPTVVNARVWHALAESRRAAAAWKPTAVTSIDASRS